MRTDMRTRIAELELEIAIISRTLYGPGGDRLSQGQRGKLLLDGVAAQVAIDIIKLRA